MRLTNLILLSALFTHCAKTTDHQTTADTVGTDYYAASEIYREADSDSLIIRSNELTNIIHSFRQSGKMVTSKEYGAGDYYGKFKIFVRNEDTLVIDKNDSGEYGFGNAQYLIKEDSLKYIRKYILESVYGENIHMIKESIFKFESSSTISLERSKTIKKLNDFGLEGIPFDTLTDIPLNQYQVLRQELNNLLKNELMAD
jgi:hypothetical protein